jgi:hypothetical protein
MIGDRHRVELDAAPERPRQERPTFTAPERPVHLTLA